jgi:hypothetical protein
MGRKHQLDNQSTSVFWQRRERYHLPPNDPYHQLHNSTELLEHDTRQRLSRSIPDRNTRVGFALSSFDVVTASFKRQDPQISKVAILLRF